LLQHCFDYSNYFFLCSNICPLFFIRTNLFCFSNPAPLPTPWILRTLFQSFYQYLILPNPTHPNDLDIPYMYWANHGKSHHFTTKLATPHLTDHLSNQFSAKKSDFLYNQHLDQHAYFYPYDTFLPSNLTYFYCCLCSLISTYQYFGSPQCQLQQKKPLKPNFIWCNLKVYLRVKWQNWNHSMNCRILLRLSE